MDDRRGSHPARAALPAALVAVMLLSTAACGGAEADGGGETGRGERTTTTEAPSRPTTTTADLAAATPVDGCDGLQTVTTGSVVHVDGTGECSVRPDPSVRGVTVTGSWEGDLECRACDGWQFAAMKVRDGSLSMIGGTEWSIVDSELDGGGRGHNAVVRTGSSVEADQPTHWRIAGNTIRGAGCKDAGSSAANRSHAVYVIGGNEPMWGVLEDNVIEHDGCGGAVKVGGTGEFGSSPSSIDGADDVTLRRNTIRNVEPGVDRTALLVATNADRIVVEDNTLEASDNAILLSGPYSGVGFVATGNVIVAPRFMLVRHWNRPELGEDASQSGESFTSFREPGPCPPWGRCEQNRAG